MKVLYFLRRRVYGGEYRRQWYAWLYYSFKGQEFQQSKSDPWPVRTPPREEIRQAIGQEIGIPPDSIQLELKR